MCILCSQDKREEEGKYINEHTRCKKRRTSFYYIRCVMRFHGYRRRVFVIQGFVPKALSIFDTLHICTIDSIRGRIK